jgi:hypothetical protein
MMIMNVYSKRGLLTWLVFVYPYSKNVQLCSPFILNDANVLYFQFIRLDLVGLVFDIST